MVYLGIVTVTGNLGHFQVLTPHQQWPQCERQHATTTFKDNEWWTMRTRALYHDSHHTFKCVCHLQRQQQQWGKWNDARQWTCHLGQYVVFFFTSFVFFYILTNACPLPPTMAATTRKMGPNDTRHIVWANSKYIITFFFILLLLNNSLRLNYWNTTTRTMNGYHSHHRNNGRRVGQGKGRAPWYVSSLSFPIFYLLNFHLHLELPRWWRMAQWQLNTPQHIETTAMAEVTASHSLYFCPGIAYSQGHGSTLFPPLSFSPLTWYHHYHAPSRHVQMCLLPPTTAATTRKMGQMHRLG